MLVKKAEVTIATNMAGRTDIKLDLAIGCGLAIGTERHESRRIEHQLRGRAGRQGDPGYHNLPLEDTMSFWF